MKEIINKPWDFALFEYGERYLLSVLCGSSAMYNVDMQLNDYEVAQYKHDGELFIEQLAKDVQTHTSKYLGRTTEIPKI